MRRALLFALVLLAAACGRPLTEGETALMTALQGDTIDTGRVRVAENRFVGITSHTYPVRPRTTCREKLLPPSEETTFTARTAGVVLGHTLHVRPDWYLEDYTRNAAGEMSLVAAMFLAHEVTHVWQWQNRALTGYHPFKAATEHGFGADPYLFDTDGTDGAERRFLEYGYEQQASIVEEYICCDTLDPDGARTARLRALLRQAMPVTDLPTAGRDIRLPWAGVQAEGICS